MNSCSFCSVNSENVALKLHNNDQMVKKIKKESKSTAAVEPDNPTTKSLFHPTYNKYNEIDKNQSIVNFVLDYIDGALNHDLIFNTKGAMQEMLQNNHSRCVNNTCTAITLVGTCPSTTQQVYLCYRQAAVIVDNQHYPAGFWLSRFDDPCIYNKVIVLSKEKARIALCSIDDNSSNRAETVSNRVQQIDRIADNQSSTNRTSESNRNSSVLTHITENERENSDLKLLRTAQFGLSSLNTNVLKELLKQNLHCIDVNDVDDKRERIRQLTNIIAVNYPTYNKQELDALLQEVICYLQLLWQHSNSLQENHINKSIADGRIAVIIHSIICNDITGQLQLMRFIGNNTRPKLFDTDLQWQEFLQKAERSNGRIKPTITAKIALAEQLANALPQYTTIKIARELIKKCPSDYTSLFPELVTNANSSVAENDNATIDIADIFLVLLVRKLANFSNACIKNEDIVKILDDAYHFCAQFIPDNNSNILLLKHALTALLLHIIVQYKYNKLMQIKQEEPSIANEIINMAREIRANSNKNNAFLLNNLMCKALQSSDHLPENARHSYITKIVSVINIEDKARLDDSELDLSLAAISAEYHTEKSIETTTSKIIYDYLCKKATEMKVKMPASGIQGFKLKDDPIPLNTVKGREQLRHAIAAHQFNMLLEVARQLGLNNDEWKIQTKSMSAINILLVANNIIDMIKTSSPVLYIELDKLLLLAQKYRILQLLAKAIRTDIDKFFPQLTQNGTLLEEITEYNIQLSLYIANTEQIIIKISNGYLEQLKQYHTSLAINSFSSKIIAYNVALMTSLLNSCNTEEDSSTAIKPVMISVPFAIIYLPYDLNKPCLMKIALGTFDSILIENNIEAQCSNLEEILSLYIYSCCTLAQDNAILAEIDLFINKIFGQSDANYRITQLKNSKYSVFNDSDIIKNTHLIAKANFDSAINDLEIRVFDETINVAEFNEMLNVITQNAEQLQHAYQNLLALMPYFYGIVKNFSEKSSNHLDDINTYIQNIVVPSKHLSSSNNPVAEQDPVLAVISTMAHLRTTQITNSSLSGAPESLQKILDYLMQQQNLISGKASTMIKAHHTDAYTDSAISASTVISISPKDDYQLYDSTHITYRFGNNITIDNKLDMLVKILHFNNLKDLAQQISMLYKMITDSNVPQNIKQIFIDITQQLLSINSDLTIQDNIAILQEFIDTIQKTTWRIIMVLLNPDWQSQGNTEVVNTKFWQFDILAICIADNDMSYTEQEILEYSTLMKQAINNIQQLLKYPPIEAKFSNIELIRLNLSDRFARQTRLEKFIEYTSAKMRSRAAEDFTVKPQHQSTMPTKKTFFSRYKDTNSREQCMQQTQSQSIIAAKPLDNPRKITVQS